MPFKSEAQRALFHMKAAGKATKSPGPTQQTAQKMIKHDTGGKLKERLTSFVQQRRAKKSQY